MIMSKTVKFFCAGTAVLAVAGLSGGAVFAAALSYTAPATITLTSPAATLTVASGSVADTLIVNAGNIVATLSSATGGSFIVSSASGNLSATASGGGGTVTTTCSSGAATLTIAQSTGSASYTIAPDSGTCTPTGSSSSSTTAAPVATGGGTPPPLTMRINDGAATTANANVIVAITGPSATGLLLSGTPDFASTTPASFTSSNAWNLCAAGDTAGTNVAPSGAGGAASGSAACAPGLRTVYARVYTLPGVFQAISASIDYEPAPAAASSTTSTPPTVGAPASNALIARIEALKAQLAALVALAGGSRGAAAPGAAIAPAYFFTRDLAMWMTGADVNELQKFLVAQAAGSAAAALARHGLTNNFGPLTRAALAEFQAKAGIKPARGYFGSVTRAWIGAHRQ